MSKYFTINNTEYGYIVDIDINLQSAKWEEKLHQLNDLIARVSKLTLNKIGINSCVDKAEFAIILADNNFIQELNLQYRGKNAPTNSLSFPAQELIPGKIDKFKFHNRFTALGDVIFAYEVIENEAILQEKDFYNHFTHLLIHGILHLLGYEHESDEEAEIMENLEIEILSMLNINSPY